MGLFNKADKASTEALSKRGESHLAPRTFNMTIGGLEKALLKEFPAEDAEKWDRTGLLVGERSLPVTRVAVALDATPGAVAAAAEAGANVLLTHHPAFLEAPDAFAPEASALESPGAVVWAAIRNQVALMDFHTALDVSPAAARVLPGMLGLQFTLRFAEPLEGSRRKGYGQICEVPDNDGEPEALARLAARCMAVFGRAPRVWGAPDAPVRRVVTATGSAASLAPALVAAGVDAVVCGEMKYHTALELAAAHDARQLLGAGLHVAEVAVSGVDGGLDAGLFLGKRRVLVVDAGDLLRGGALELGHLLVAGGHDDAALGQLVQLLAQALDLEIDALQFEQTFDIVARSLHGTSLSISVFSLTIIGENPDLGQGQWRKLRN